jgi:hypothetical protein
MRHNPTIDINSGTEIYEASGEESQRFAAVGLFGSPDALEDGCRNAWSQ